MSDGSGPSPEEMGLTPEEMGVKTPETEVSGNPLHQLDETFARLINEVQTDTTVADSGEKAYRVFALENARVNLRQKQEYLKRRFGSKEFRPKPKYHKSPGQRNIVQLGGVGVDESFKRQILTSLGVQNADQVLAEQETNVDGKTAGYPTEFPTQIPDVTVLGETRYIGRAGRAMRGYFTPVICIQWTEKGFFQMANEANLPPLPPTPVAKTSTRGR